MQAAISGPTTQCLVRLPRLALQLCPSRIRIATFAFAAPTVSTFLLSRFSRSYASGNQSSPPTYLGDKKPIERSALFEERNAKQRRRKALGEFSPEAKALAQRILDGEISAAKYLQEQISSQKITSEQVRTCLLAVLQRILSYPRSSRTAILKRDEASIARIVLQALWQDESLWLPIMVYDERATLAVCYFAISEDLEPFLTRWLNVDTHHDDTNLNYRGWKGWLLRNILNAFLLYERNQSATRALQYFFEILEQKDRIKEVGDASISNFKKMSVGPAIRLLAAELSLGNFGETDITLWNRFFKFYAKSPVFGISTPIVKDFILSAMSLKHPGGARPDDLLRFLKKHLGDKKTPEDFDKFVDAVALTEKRLKGNVILLRDTLRRRGRTEEADWVARQASRLKIKPMVKKMTDFVE